MPVVEKYKINQVTKAKKINTKYIFVSGGVMSALGKGVTAASIALLLKQRGFKVCPIKCENNLNVDFGTLNPIEHGDPFLCFDGLEADQDLGNYERFLEQQVGNINFMTMGQLYSTVISRERRMEYDGEDVEPIPHIVDEIIDRIHKAADETEADLVIVELGGTVGEYENNNGLYYEAARIIGLSEQVAHVHVTYVPVPPHIGEPKTKPAQMGIKQLMSMGINANFIVIRSEMPVDEQRRYKLGMKFHIPGENVFSNENLETIYRVPLLLHEQGLDGRILDYFNLEKNSVNLIKWKQLVKKIETRKRKAVKIAIVGKYFGTGSFQLKDAYYALFEALQHAAWWHNLDLEIKPINSELDVKEIIKSLKETAGIIVPIGWGKRGVDGMLAGIKYARERKVPYLGLCYGMQLACVEFARNAAGLQDSHSVEVNPQAKHLIIHSIPFDKRFQVIKGDGCSMRLGTYDCVLRPGTLAYAIYEKHGGIKENPPLGKEGRPIVVQERHRHRYEFNNNYQEVLEKAGMVFSGMSPDGMFVEMIELPWKTHPFFVATQGHPEYRSYPLKPHPMFIEFIRAAISGW